MRFMYILVLVAVTSGCACGVPIAAGGTAEEPSFLLLSNDKTLTSLVVACEDASSLWQTKWQLSGTTSAQTIEYGKAPQSMRVVNQAAHLPSLGLCAVEARANNAKGRTCVSRTLLLVSAPLLTQCTSKHDCERELLEQMQ
jgi:hypothetical protein